MGTIRSMDFNRERLRRLVEDASKPQYRIEEEAGMSKGYLSRLLHDDQRGARFSVDMAQRLAAALGCDASELIGSQALGALPRTTSLEPTLSQVAGYERALIGAAQKSPRLSREALELAGRVRLPVRLALVTSELLGAQAQVVSDALRLAASQAEKTPIDTKTLDDGTKTGHARVAKTRTSQRRRVGPKG